jgi:hypothetical protein
VGRIWVQDYRPPRILGGPRHRDWTILDPDGTPLARLEGEEARDILEIGEDHAVVVQTDELGVERVVMLRIESAAEYAERQ